MREPILAGLILSKMAFKPYSYKRKRKFEARMHTHIIILAAILVFIASKKNAFTNKQIVSSHKIHDEFQSSILLQIYKPVYATNIKRRTSCQQNHVKVIIYLLLINDIHPNPGPNSNGTL